jgi:hypothetical protein
MSIRPVLLVLCGICSIAAHAGMLVADGLLRTVGVDRSVVRLTVVPEFSEPYVVQHSGGRFELELPYHAHYVLRAEAPGCATKEVVFNVNLPVRLNGLERPFPLEILMERMPDGATFHYAGPVGLVFFDETKQAFEHTTDHSRIYENSPVLLAIHKAEGFADDGLWAVGPTPVAQPVGDPLAARLPQLQLGQVLQTTSTKTANGNRTTRVVGEAPYQAALIDPEPTRPPARPLPVSAKGVPDIVAPRASTEPSPTIAISSTIVNAMERVVDVVQSKPTMVEHAEAHPIDPRTDAPAAECGTTESNWIGRCLVTVDRLSTGIGCTELRKAEHIYGAVFYFHDGRSITEHHYKQLLGGVVGE